MITRRLFTNMGSESSLSTLQAFLDTLEEEMEWEFNLDNFDDRLRLQKFVYLSSDFGFEHPYSYGMHLRGPYSPPLAQDYYSDLDSIAPDEDSISEFDSEHFVKFVANREVRWLEVAATLRAYIRTLQNGDCQKDLPTEAIQMTIEEKNEKQDYVEKVFEEMNRVNTLNNQAED